MANHDHVTPYEEEVAKKKQVTKMFDGIAPYYDLLNRALSLGIDTIWRTKAISMLKKNKPDRILDIATGTADLAIEAAKTLKPSQIIGMDIAKEMLRIGDKKIAKKQLDHIITLEHGDSENLHYDTQAFPDYQDFADILKGIGFTDVTYRPLSFGICTIYLARK